MIVALAAATSTFHLPFKPVERLLNDQTTGRQEVWQDALVGWRTSPIGGVGPDIREGLTLSYLSRDGCQVTPTLERNQITCPAALGRWSSTWLIAHNAWLHWLLESGILGLAGLCTVMVYTLWRAMNLGHPFTVAVLFGFTAMNVVDVVIAVPSPFCRIVVVSGRSGS